MSLLTIVQDVADMVGLPRPSGAFSSTDTTVRQMITLSNMEGRMLASRHPWSRLTTGAVHTVTLAQPNQGTITDLFPGFKYIVNETMWNKDDERYVRGPASTPEWRELRVREFENEMDQTFHIRQGYLLIFPGPAIDEEFHFDYQSSHWCASSGGTTQAAWGADTDVGLLDEDLLKSGLHWRFLRAKGMDYAQEFQDYEWLVSEAFSRDGGRDVKYLSRSVDLAVPGIRAPDGNWTP